ncbi:MAG: trypsin-like serine protease [Polyangiaceae bacterium]|nr:trypsin-like serine protease [Polyangiaceae bacterium]
MRAQRPLLVLLVPLVAAAACRPSAPSPDRFTSQVNQASTPAPAVAPAAPLIAPLSSGARIEDERNTIAVFRDAAASTVFVTQTRVVVDYLAGVAEEVPSGSGSGFVWDMDGHIVTNYHVVKDAKSLTVTFRDHKTFQATVVGVEPRKDIAVLKVEGAKDLLKPVTVAKSQDLDVGQKTVAIGNPFGLDHTLTTGVVSALGRQVQGIGGVTIRDMIQTDAAINPGNSGGPLLDSAGQLIGMNTMIYSRSGSSAGIGFAVPSSTIGRVVSQIVKSGKAEQLGLGIKLDPMGRVERQLGIKGVAVISVPEASPAAKAGLQGLKDTPRGLLLGDVIVKIGESKVESYDDFYNALDQRKAGEKVDVTVKRGETTATLKLDVLVVN